MLPDFFHFDFLAAATKTRTRSSLAKRRRSWQMNRKQQEQNLVGIPPAAREKKSYRPAHGQVNSPVYLPAPTPWSELLGYFESELLLDFGSVLSWLGSVLSGLDDELPRSGTDFKSELLLMPSFSAVLSSRTPVIGRLLLFWKSRSACCVLASILPSSPGLRPFAFSARCALRMSSEVTAIFSSLRFGRCTLSGMVPGCPGMGLVCGIPGAGCPGIGLVSGIPGAGCPGIVGCVSRGIGAIGPLGFV